MGRVIASNHAIERYQERVSHVSREDAKSALTSRKIEAAAEFGAKYVKLGNGCRVALEENGPVTVVVTVLPSDCKTVNVGYFLSKKRR